MKPRQIALGALLIAALPACSTTSLVSRWRAPDAQPVELRGKKVAALVIDERSSTRRAAETTLAREVSARGGEGIPAFTLIPDDDVQNEERVRSLLEKAGIDGLVSLRVVDSNERVTYTPGSYERVPAYYRDFWGYWRRGWQTVYRPGLVRSDTVVAVETLAYSLLQNKLLWAGTSESVSPSRVESLVQDIAAEVAKAMVKDGALLPAALRPAPTAPTGP